MLDFTPKFGRLENPDERDALFPVSAVLPAPDPFITEKYWWDGGWWGNQGESTHCVCYSWMHWTEDGPVVQDEILANRSKPLFNPTLLYRECQIRDPWPGTCVDADTECFTRDGWKLYSELKVGEEIYTLNLDTQKSEWAILDAVNIFENSTLIKFSNSKVDIRTTPNHKWVVRNRITRTPYKLVEAENINSAHEIPLSFPCADLPEVAIYSDEFVKLIAWVVTEGHLRKSIRKRHSISVSHKKYKNELKAILLENGITVGYETKRGVFECEFGGDVAASIRRILTNDKQLDLNFIFSLTITQLELFIHHAILGDGSIRQPTGNRKVSYSFHQNPNTGNILTAFELACVLSGKSISGGNPYNEYFNSSANTTEQMCKVTLLGADSMAVRRMERELVPNQMVWCPSSKNNTFLARRGQTVFYTGNSYPGTSVRTAAKILHELGVIREYRWANNSEEVAQAFLNLGPVVVGTRWTHDMAYPKPNGRIRPTGASLGGHAYLLNGVDYTKKMFRIKNSWGREWGKNGYAFISFEDFDYLLSMGGEATIAFENKLTAVPTFEGLSPPTSA